MVAVATIAAAVLAALAIIYSGVQARKSERAASIERLRQSDLLVLRAILTEVASARAQNQRGEFQWVSLGVIPTLTRTNQARVEAVRTWFMDARDTTPQNDILAVVVEAIRATNES